VSPAYNLEDKLKMKIEVGRQEKLWHGPV